MTVFLSVADFNRLKAQKVKELNRRKTYRPQGYSEQAADFSAYDAGVRRNQEASREYGEDQRDIRERHERTRDSYDRADAQIKADAATRHQEEYQRDQLRNQREMINAVNRQNFQLQKETRQMRDAERQRSTNRNGFRFNMGIFD